MRNLISRFLGVGAVSMMATVVHAQNSGSILDWTYNNIVYVLAGVVVLGAGWALVRLSSNLLALRQAELMKEMGVKPEQIVSSFQTPSWKRIYDWLWSMVPIGKEETVDLGHDYDGIRELDNRLPPWWLGIFYGSIIFGIGYMIYYHGDSDRWSSKMEYEQAMEIAEREKQEMLAQMANLVDETNAEMLTSEADLAEGKSIYMDNCASCHGQLGEGLVGPNFADAYWIHGGDIKDLFKTIKYGVPEKGMISWSSMLSPSAMQQVASYILTLQGTNPPNQKEAQGELYDPETAPDTEVLEASTSN